ncbi:MAG TPA: choice-of-anchor D domain-containing protein [Candidatus Binataceae bacterium]|nr:choice-of-anchor D domain-containing protein [Candidatus Binataceae bacterium]
MKSNRALIAAGLGAVFFAIAIRAAIGSSTVAPTASIVLGQTDFTHNTLNLIDGKGFNTTGSVAIDRSVTPNRVYVLDRGNGRLLGWQNVTNLTNGAPADLVIGQPDFATVGPCTNPSGPTANNLCFNEFYQQTYGQSSLIGGGAVAVDAAGNVYLADTGNNRVLEYDQPFANDTVADRVYGQPDFITNSQVAPSPTSLFLPSGLAFDTLGNLYVADSGNSRVLEYNSPLTNNSANMSFGSQGGLFSTQGCATGAGGLCLFEGHGPIDTTQVGIAVDQSNNLYVADVFNCRVLQYDDPIMTQNSNAVAVVGPGSLTSTCGGGAVEPFGLAFDNGNNLYVSSGSNVIRYSTPQVVLNGTGPAPDLALSIPGNPAVDSNGNVYVPDIQSARVVVYDAPISSGMNASLVLGQGTLANSKINMVDGVGLATPDGVAIDTSVTPNRLYVADPKNNRVLGYTNVKALTNGNPADIVIGQPDLFSSNCNQSVSASPPPTASTLCLSQGLVGGLAVDPFGNLYVTDSDNKRVLEYDSPFTTDTVADRVFGTCGSFTSNNCSGRSAQSLSAPGGLAVDQTGRLFISDNDDNRVLGYSHPLLSQTADLVIGQQNFTGNLCNSGTTATSGLCGPAGVTTDLSGDLLVADSGNSRILSFPAPLVTGESGTLVGSVKGPFTPSNLAMDSSGDLYAVDTFDRVVEFAAPLSPTSPVVSTLGTQSCAGPVTASSLCMQDLSGAIALDAGNNLYVADSSNNRVLVFPSAAATPTPTATATATATATPTPTPTPAALKVSPPTLGFGAVKVGRSSSAKAVTVSNPKNKRQSSVVTFSGFSVSGSFELDSGGTTCGGTLAPGAKCKIRVVFSPATAGVQTGTLTINSNASNPSLSVALKGKGKAPK